MSLEVDELILEQPHQYPEWLSVSAKASVLMLQPREQTVLDEKVVQALIGVIEERE